MNCILIRLVSRIGKMLKSIAPLTVASHLPHKVDLSRKASVRDCKWPRCTPHRWILLLAWSQWLLKVQVRKLSSRLLFLTYARLRFSDAMLSTKEPALHGHEGLGFLETGLFEHKTANRRRTTINHLLPGAAPIPGVHSGKWAEVWLGLESLRP